MGALIIISLILLGVVLVQIGKVNELSASIRGEEQAQENSNNLNAIIGMVFMIAFLVLCIGSFIYYKDSMLGYGPLEAASIHGILVDNIFDVTMVICGIVFFITHILLFWYAYKYRARKGHTKAQYIPHDNRLEIVWMVVPSIVMTFLVIGGLNVWNKAMADIPADDVPGVDFIEIEANAQQFGWNLRYPGADNLLGAVNYKLIGPSNTLGQVWEDTKNHDDFFADKIVLPVNKKVRVRITSRDVLHNFYLPHFRVKMDAVPGMPTYFVFTPTMTTEEFKQGLINHGGQWADLSDPADPGLGTRGENFEFELACAELCGNGHFSMRKVVEIVTEDEYKAWLAEQNSYYRVNVLKEDPKPKAEAVVAPEAEEDIEEETPAEDEATPDDNGEVTEAEPIIEEANADKTEVPTDNEVTPAEDKATPEPDVKDEAAPEGDGGK